jgi:hypothetical protein
LRLKNAALLALIGTTPITALLLWTFVFTFFNVLRGLVPAAMLFQSFIHAFGCFSFSRLFALSFGGCLTHPAEKATAPSLNVILREPLWGRADVQMHRLLVMNTLSIFLREPAVWTIWPQYKIAAECVPHHLANDLFRLVTVGHH